MGDREKYLDRLEDLEKKPSFKKVRKIYREIRKRSEEDKKDKDPNAKFRIYNRGIDFVNDRKPIENKTEATAIAYDILSSGIREGDPKYTLTGARMYEKLGRGAKVIPKLMKGIEIAYSKDKMKPEHYREAKEFIERNTEEKKGVGLEGRMSIFLLFLIGGVALSFASFSMTGNAVSNLTGTTQGLSGLILIIAGLTGLFFSFKK